MTDLNTALNQRVPYIFIDEIILESLYSQVSEVSRNRFHSLSAIINMSIKERKESIGDGIFSDISGRFEDERLLKDNIEVAVIQSSKKTLTDLINSSDAFKFISCGDDFFHYQLALYKAKINNRINSSDTILSNREFINKGLNTDEINRSLDLMKSSEELCFIKRYSLDSFKVTDLEKYLDVKSEDKHYSYKISTSDDFVPSFGFNFQNEVTEGLQAFNTKHLTYFVVAYYKNNIISDTNIESSYMIEKSQLRDLAQCTGHVNSRTVFDNKELITNSLLFFDINGNRYAGPAHKMPDGSWMSESSHDINSSRLTTRLSSDLSIKDLRNITRIKHLRSEQYDLSRRRNIENNQGSFFSDLFLSTDQYGNFMAGFAFDLGNSREGLINRYCRFPRLFERIGGDVNRFFKIRKIDLLRRRVKNRSTTMDSYINSRRLNPGSSGVPINNSTRSQPIIPFDINNPVEDIVCRMDRNLNSATNRRFAMSPRLENIYNDSDVVEVKNNLNYLRRMNLPNTSAVFYTLMDTDLKFLETGNYQYGVEIEIEDGSINLLRTMRDELTNDLSNLSTFETYIQNNNYYNHLLSKFVIPSNPPYIVEYRAQMTRALENIEVYYYILTGHIIDASILARLADPEVGTLYGLSRIMTAQLDLITIISEKISSYGSSPRNYESNNLSFRPSGSNQLGRQGTGVFKIKKFFSNEVASAQEFKLPGAEFVEPDPVENYRGDFVSRENSKEKNGEGPSRNSSGLKIISAERLKTLIQNSGQAGTLRPRVVTTLGQNGNKAYNLQEPSVDTRAVVTEIESNVLSSRINDNEDVTVQGADNTSTDTSQEPEQRRTISAVNNFSLFLNNQFNCDVRAGSTNRRWRNDRFLSSEDKANVEMNDTFGVTSPITGPTVDLGTEQRRLSSMSTNTLQTKDIDKNLKPVTDFLSSLANITEDGIVDRLQINRDWFDINSVQVKVFTGFSINSGGGKNMKEPIFEVVDLIKATDMINSSGEFLCMLDQKESSDTLNKLNKIPIYNRYFVVRSSNYTSEFSNNEFTVTEESTRQRVRQRIYRGRTGPEGDLRLYMKNSVGATIQSMPIRNINFENQNTGLVSSEGSLELLGDSISSNQYTAARAVIKTKTNSY